MQNSYSSLYEEIETIKQTANIQVLLVLQRSSKDFFVAKKANIYELDEQKQDLLFNQCRLLKELNHPHILKYKDIFLEGESLIQIIEYCQEGDLANYLSRRIERKEYLSQKLILNWVLQILMGLEYIHQKKIIHRGIRLKNIYINSKGNLKLGSFGESKVLNETLSKAITIVGSMETMSPQMMEGKPYDSKTDLWAVGCLLFELCTYKGIFSHLSLAQMYQNILEAKVPDLPAAYSKYLQVIYKKLLKKNPASRPSTSELLRMPIFLKMMEEYLKKKRIDSIQIKDVPVKKLRTHDKLINKKKQKVVLPTIIKRQASNDKQKIASKSPNKPNIQKKSPTITNKMPQIQPSKAIQKDNTVVQDQLRLTKRHNQQQQLSLQRLYQLQIMIICKQLEQKYSPKMQQILQKTLEYDPE